MDERASRIFIGLCLLVLLWIGVYWWWKPGVAPQALTITFDPARSTSGGSDAPDARPDQDADAAGPAEARRGASRPDAGEPGVGGPAVPDGRVIPPSFVEHVWRDGDSLSALAERRYGSADLWTAIARANPLRDFRRVRAGDTIRVPLDPGNVQGVVSGEDPTAPARMPPPDAPRAFETYVVQANENLSVIAKKVYGRSALWKRIYEANRDQLSSPDVVRQGQTLRIPPAPAE